MNVRLFEKGRRDKPVAEGEATGIAKLLIMYGTADHYEVHDGENYVDAREFMVKLGGPVRPADGTTTPADGTMTPEERMRVEDLFDPVIHARNVTIEQWIARAIRLSHEPHYLPDLLAKSTAQEIIRLFY